MISQIVSVGGGWGTATRTMNGIVQCAVAIFLWRSVKFSYPRLRPWRAALAAGWMALALSLLAAPVGVIPSTLTPWIVHGVLIVLGPVVALAHRHANRVARQAEADLLGAMDGDAP